MTIVETRAVTGGVDTHADVHVAAALDSIGGLRHRRNMWSGWLPVEPGKPGFGRADQ
jgi:hypothetical protein